MVTLLLFQPHVTEPLTATRPEATALPHWDIFPFHCPVADSFKLSSDVRHTVNPGSQSGQRLGNKSSGHLHKSELTVVFQESR